MTVSCLRGVISFSIVAMERTGEDSGLVSAMKRRREKKKKSRRGHETMYIHVPWLVVPKATKYRNPPFFCEGNQLLVRMASWIARAAREQVYNWLPCLEEGNGCFLDGDSTYSQVVRLLGFSGGGSKTAVWPGTLKKQPKDEGTAGIGVYISLSARGCIYRSRRYCTCRTGARCCAPPFYKLGVALTSIDQRITCEGAFEHMQENYWSEEYDTFCVGIAREERGEQGSREYGSRGGERWGVGG